MPTSGVFTALLLQRKRPTTWYLALHWLYPYARGHWRTHANDKNQFRDPSRYGSMCLPRS